MEGSGGPTNARGRTEKDRFCPNDVSKLRYWVLDDESLTFSNMQELSMALEIGVEINKETAEALTSDGGYFDAAGDIPCGGVNSGEAARLADVHANLRAAEATTGRNGKRKKGDGKAKNESGGTSTGSSGAGGNQPPKTGDPGTGAAGTANTDNDAQLMAKQSSLLVAKACLKELSKKVGDGGKMVLECARADASPTLIAQLEDSVDAMRKQYKILDEQVAQNYQEPTDYYKTMNDAAKAQIDWYIYRLLWGASFQLFGFLNLFFLLR